MGEAFTAEAAEWALISRIAAGAKEEFAQLVTAHEQQIFSMIMRQVGDFHIAEELTQESFVRAYKGLQSFQRRCRFSSWVTRIALNVISSYFGSKRFRQHQQDVSFDPEQHDLQEESGDDSMCKESALLALRTCLAELKPRFRDVVVLCSIEGRSYADAAQVLQIPEGTVASRLHQGIALLKSKMRKRGL